MHPSVWNWFQSGLTSTFPLVGTAVTSPQGPGGQVDAHQSAVQLTDEYGPAIRGKLANGVLVCVDGNVPTNLGVGTNQSEIYAVASRECHLWTDPAQPAMIRAEQPAAASLGILLVCYLWAAYSFRRISGAVPQKIGGTGLVVQAGF
jgi:hypothetical protein